MTKARSNATANAAKGDLTVGNGTNLSGVLGVGSDGETIVADSSTSTGLRYQSAYNGNAVINGAFDIWQRGTSIPIGTFYPYTADRWQGVRGGVVAGMTVSRQSSGLTSFQYCARIQRDSGNTSTATLQLFNAFESANSYQFAGQAVTFSFYARAGANYSGGVLSGYVGTGTGTDQNPITASYTGGASSIIVSATLNGSTWTRYQGTATLPAGTTEMYTQFTYTPTGTAGTNDYVEVTGVQIELGSIATTFKRAGGTIQGELAACQRYLPSIGTGNSEFAAGFAYSTTKALFPINFQVTPRVSPTGISVNSAGNFTVRNATATQLTCTALTWSTGGVSANGIEATVASGLVAGNGTNILNSGSGTLLFTGCEL